jgi:hypothetical protein
MIQIQHVIRNIVVSHLTTRVVQTFDSERLS